MLKLCALQLVSTIVFFGNIIGNTPLRHIQKEQKEETAQLALIFTNAFFSRDTPKIPKFYRTSMFSAVFRVLAEESGARAILVGWVGLTDRVGPVERARVA